MQFLMMTTDSGSTPPTPELYAAMGKLIEEMTRAGVLLATGAFDPRSKVHVQNQGGKITVTDGPFTEAKEGIIGFALMEAKSLEQALEYSKKFWEVGGDGAGDIYPVIDPG